MRSGKVTGAILLLLLALGTLVYFNEKPRQEPPVVVKGPMHISSTAFAEEQAIPVRYTCDGENVHPPLSIANVPDGTQSLALIVDDPDAPGGTFLHWTLWNISPETTLIDEGQIPENAREGVTGFGTSGYGGPCPPSSTHRYFFKLYALDEVLDLPADAALSGLVDAINGHVIGTAELVGIYARQGKS